MTDETAYRAEREWRQRAEQRVADVESENKALKERIKLLEEMRDINGFITIHTDKTSQVLLDENKALKEECERVAVEFHKAKNKADALVKALNSCFYWLDLAVERGEGNAVLDRHKAREAIAAYGDK